MIAFDWYNFLVVARVLSRRPRLNADEIALLRTAIGRTYYATFNIARDYLEQIEGVVVPVANVHNFVAGYFRHSPDPRYTLIGRYLYELRDERNRADYDRYFSNVPRAARQVLRNATTVIEMISQL